MLGTPKQSPDALLLLPHALPTLALAREVAAPGCQYTGCCCKSNTMELLVLPENVFCLPPKSVPRDGALLAHP